MTCRLCPRQIRKHYFLCAAHWALLPHEIKREVMDAARKLQAMRDKHAAGRLDELHLEFAERLCEDIRQRATECLRVGVGS